MTHRDYSLRIHAFITKMFVLIFIFFFYSLSFAQGEWTELNPATKPVVRYQAAVAFDSSRGVLVLFGGRDHPAIYSDTWEFDGSTWAQKFPAVKPGARYSHKMVFDSSRNVVVLFGGNSSTGFKDDTWEWNGTNWSQKTPVNKPDNRFDHGMAYDRNRNVTVLFGGETYASQGTYLGDTWEWNGSNWTDVTPTGTNPNARKKLALEWDGVNQKVMLFGGEWSTTKYQDTWLFDGTSWTALSPVKSPDGRTDFAMSYEGIRNKVVLYGGTTSGGGNDETWLWNGSNWSELSPSSSPGLRYHHTMAYDSANDRVYLFGGIGGSSVKKNDVWHFQSNDPPKLESLDPVLDSRMWRTFTVVISDLNSANDIDQVWFLINTSLSGSNAVYLYYDAGSNEIKLRNDAGTSWSTGAIPGSAVDLNNSQCTLRVSGVTVTKSGNTFTIKIPIIFKTAFIGKKNVYGYVEDTANANDGWHTLGVFYVSPSAMPLVDSLNPASGTGHTQVFEATCSDPDGINDIRYLYFKIADNAGQASNCAYVRYRRATNKLDLRTDDGSSWIGGYVLGTANTLENSQIHIDVSSSSTTIAGNNLTLHIDCTFKSELAGAKKTYMNVYDMSYVSPGWTQMGTYNVNAPPENISVTPNSGSNYMATFQPKYKDSNGTNDLRYLYFKISTLSGATANCAYIRYRHATHKVDIRTDDGTSWIGGNVIGCPGTTENSQFSFDCSSSSMSTSGNEITLSLPLTFKNPFAGSKKIYMNAIDMNYASAGWQQMGTFTVTEQNFAPTNQSVFPNSGSGGWKTFDAVYRDANGADDLKYLYFKIADSSSAAANCVYIRYRCVTGKFDLRTNAGGGWIYGPVIGTTSTVQNSQVSINLQHVTDNRNGNDLTLRLPLVFKSGFNGSHKIYMYCSDKGGLTSGWQQMGTFTVSASAPSQSMVDRDLFDLEIDRGQKIYFDDYLNNSSSAVWFLDNKRLDENQPTYKFNRRGMHRLDYLMSNEHDDSYGGEDLFVSEKLEHASDLTSLQAKQVPLIVDGERIHGILLAEKFNDGRKILRLRGVINPEFRLIFNYKNPRNYHFIGVQEGNNPESWVWVMGVCRNGVESVITSEPAKLSGMTRVFALNTSPENGLRFYLDRKRILKSASIEETGDRIILRQNLVPDEFDLIFTKPVK